MQAFHNDPTIKAKYVSRMQAHRAAEHLTQGIGFQTSRDEIKGCAVGCTLDAYDHTRYPIELGLPEWLARLEDRIFEGLPKGKAEQFAEDFLMVIPVGADVSKVRGKLAVLRLTRQLPALEANPEPYAREVEAALKGVIAWHEAGEPESAARSAAWSAWSAAESARSAESAARSAAAWSAAWSAAESAWSAAWSAWSAAESARSAAAWSAAWSAAESAESAAWSAAWSAESHFEWEAATLLQLLKECV